MVRATRSTVIQQDTDVAKISGASPSPPLPKVKQAGRKRKRSSAPTEDEQPSLKQQRNDVVMEVETLNEEQTESLDSLSPQEYQELQFVGDLPLNDVEATKILDILEAIDTQGLLDRIFPLHQSAAQSESDLPSSPSTSKHTSPSVSVSLRTLLKDPQSYSLHIIRSGINHLFPIFSRRRSRTSPPALQQLQFCELALSLVEQASRSNLDVRAVRYEDVLPDPQNDGSVSPVSETRTRKRTQTPERQRQSAPRRYALVQRLPTGEYWTSLNSQHRAGSPQQTELPNLQTGHAELVSILPLPSSSSSNIYASSSSHPSSSSSTFARKLPTLGDLHLGKKTGSKSKPQGARYVSCGSFLDYGPYAGFAPSFEGEGCEVGRGAVGEVLLARWRKGKMREKARAVKAGLLRRMREREENGMDLDEAADEEVVEVAAAVTPSTPSEKGKEKAVDNDNMDVDLDLESLLSAEEIDAMRTTIEGLELEKTINELLERCSRAIVRLKELQEERLKGESGGSSGVERESEEWVTAQNITDTFALLLSLRPRNADSKPAIIPPPAVLKMVQRTLPTQPTEGWWGTLPVSRANALRDDSTLYIQPGASSPTPTTTPSTPAATASAVTAAAASTALPANVSLPLTTPAYSASQTYAQQNLNYAAYAGYGQAFRAPGYPYTPGAGAAGAGYYPNAYAPQGQNTGATGAPQYNYGLTSQASAYSPYAGWFSSYQGPASASTAAATNGSTPSGHGTPTPTATAAYQAYYAQAQAQASSRAVGNTVTGTSKAQNGWGGAPGYVAPTLPPHLRPALSGAPSTPTPASASPVAVQSGQ